MRKKLCVFWLLCLLHVLSAAFPPPARADYDRAVQLYNRGDFPAAFRKFLPLAEAGDGDAQQAVGLMYEKGRGGRENLSWTNRQLDGVSLRCPAGWRVERGNREGMIYIAGKGGERLLVWPILTRGRLNEATASRLTASLTRLVEPGVSLLEQPRPIGPEVIRAVGGGQGRKFVGSLFWVATPMGDAATYVLASAESGSFSGTVPVFAEILSSLSLRGSGKGVAASGRPAGMETDYVRFTDPSEGAFTVEIPSGWRPTGGLARFNASDVRPWLRLVSADGRMQVFMGDPRIPSMLVPNAPLAAMGFTEGMTYDAGYNQRFLIRSYRPGQEAARLYLQENLSEGCPDRVVEDFRDRPELAAAINRIFREHSSPFGEQQLHTGEIAGSCPGVDLAQYVFAGTLLSRIPSPQGEFGMWVLNYLYGFQAPRADADLALAVTRHLADSFRVTEEWARMNGGLQSRVAEIVARTGAEIARTVSEGYWQAQRTQEKGFEQYGQAIRGLEETLDPLTGERVEVVSGFNHNWIDHQGHVVGTQTDTSPGIDFRQLLQAGME